MDILTEILAALRAHEPVVLATIVSSFGSTPLPTGSSMLITQRGARVLGTVGGGLLEANVTREAKEFFADRKESVIREFELNESGSGEGMICGGNVDILIERIGETSIDVFAQLVARRGGGNDCTLLRHIDRSGGVTRVAIEGMDEDVVSLPAVERILREAESEPDVLVQLLQRSHREDFVGRSAASGGELIIQPITGVQPLVICGGGHVGRALARIAASSGFTVTVIDDREEYATSGRFPDAARVIAKKWDDAFAELVITSSTYFVIVTRAHQSDRDVLRLALGTPARYIGMIGSGRKVSATYDSLLKEGISVEALRRVHAPIGLDIAAVTAEEIAVSIVAELVRERRHFPGVSTPLSDKMNRWFDKFQ